MYNLLLIVLENSKKIMQYRLNSGRVAGLNNRICCTYWTKKQSHLRTSHDFAHLAELALVVQKIDNPIHSTNPYPVDSAIDP